MKPTGYLLCLVLGFLVFGSLAGAQQQVSSANVPRLVSFSGKATDEQGKPIVGPGGATFAIYKDREGGSALWMETQNITADKTGHYTVQLGASKAEGLPLELFSTGEARWLGVRINGGEEQGRTLLLSVPYALKAADAETLGGKPASAFMVAPVAGGRSKATPSKPNPDLGGTGTTNHLARWKSNTQLGNSVVYQDSAGNIGIGTTTPGSKLDVKGTTALRGATTVTGNLASSGNVSAGGSLSAAGNVSASGSISANGSVAASNMTATSSGGPAMWGENFGSGGASDGMHGIAHGPASGVAGISDNANGVGVWGQSPGWALYAFGNTGQDRASGGWVKAMAEVNAYYTPYKITKCFNSTLAGAAATTPPCGIYFLEVYFGYWEFDFGFETDDRFVIASLEASDSWGTTIRAYPGNGSLVYVISADGNGNYQNALFVLMVF